MVLELVLAAAVSPAHEQLLRSARVEPSPAVPFAAAPAACVFDGRTGLPVPTAAALARARAARVVYAGEKHDSAAHHAAQAALLDELLASDPRTGGAFEMLHVTQQASLDQYLSGTLDADAFQKAVDWPKTWGFSFELYRPLFERLRGGRGAALNVPKSVVHKVAVSGLESLTPEEKAFVPPDLRRTEDAAYLGMLAETYRAHGGDPAEPVGFGRYVDAMTLWNEGMAAALARFVDGGPALVAAGAFHVYAAGIPEGLARRAPGVEQVSFVFLDKPACPAKLEPAELALAVDYYWTLTP